MGLQMPQHRKLQTHLICFMKFRKRFSSREVRLGYKVLTSQSSVGRTRAGQEKGNLEEKSKVIK